MKWGFFQAYQLWWLALTPLVICFYLMKLTRHERLVSALFLWQRATSQARVDSFWQRLRHNLFLWLQLLLLALMVLALARPYHVQPGRLPKQVALVLDQSASMGARHSGGKTRFQMALAEARALLRQAPAGTEFLLAGLAMQPRIYVPFSRDREKLEKALDDLSWEAVEGHSASLLPLALSLTRSNAHCEVLFFSDQSAEGEGDSILGGAARLIPCGHGGRNLAVSAFQLEEEEGHLRAFASLRSYSNQAEEVSFRILDGQGKTVLTRGVPLAARGQSAVNLDLPALEGPLELRLDGQDDLEVDNSAWSIVAPKRSARVLVKGEISPFLRQALLAQENLTLVSETSLRGEPTCTVWGVAPGKLAPGNHIVEAAARSSSPGGHEESLSADSKGPLANLPLGDLWAARVTAIDYGGWTGEPLQPQPWLLTPQSQPAVVQLKGRQHNLLAFAFRLEESNLPLHPALPLLLARYLETTRASALADFPRQVRCGQEIDWSGTASLRLESPLKVTSTLEPSAGKLVYTPIRPGVYRLSSTSAEPTNVTWVANFASEHESDLDPPKKGEAAATPTLLAPREAAPTPASSQPFAAEYWRWAVAAVLGLSILEWVLYWRPQRKRRRP